MGVKEEDEKKREFLLCVGVCVCVHFILNKWRNRVGPMAAYKKAVKEGARLWHSQEPPSLDFSLLFAALNSRGPWSIPSLPQHHHMQRLHPIKTFFLPARKENDATNRFTQITKTRKGKSSVMWLSFMLKIKPPMIKSDFLDTLVWFTQFFFNISMTTQSHLWQQ